VSQPPAISDPVWDLGDGGQWKTANHYPVYAVPGAIGHHMVEELTLYSGNVTSVPFGYQLIELNVDPRNYVRIYTAITVSNLSSLPDLWVFLLVISVLLIAVLGITSLLRHLIQRRRRESLRRRVMAGEVDLEALGIKRLTVPLELIKKIPLFIYTCDIGDPSPEAYDVTNMSSVKPLGFEVSGPSLTESLRSARPPSSILARRYGPQSQPTCPICLEDFESGYTTIRELSCLHIFHPECIDTFLSENSSLCPMCKKSALPFGYCPPVITNPVVRRERAIRRLRSRVTIMEEISEGENGAGNALRARWRSSGRRLFRGERVESMSSTEMRHQSSPTYERPVYNILGRPERLSRQDMARERAHHLPRISDAEDYGGSDEGPTSGCKCPALTMRPTCSACPSFLLLTTPSGRKTMVKAFPGFK